MLPANDTNYLIERFNKDGYTVTSEANMTCIIIKDYPLPTGFNCEKSDLLLRLSPGYPDLPPDMWWFDPPLQRLDKKVISAIDLTERHLNRNWQRWSRHIPHSQWRSGIDALESFFALMHKELESSVKDPI